MRPLMSGFFLLNIKSVRFFHIDTCSTGYLFFISGYYFNIWIDCPLLLLSTVDGYILFLSLAPVSKAAVDITVCV